MKRNRGKDAQKQTGSVKKTHFRESDRWICCGPMSNEDSQHSHPLSVNTSDITSSNMIMSSADVVRPMAAIMSMSTDPMPFSDLLESSSYATQDVVPSMGVANMPVSTDPMPFSGMLDSSLHATQGSLSDFTALPSDITLSDTSASADIFLPVAEIMPVSTDPTRFSGILNSSSYSTQDITIPSMAAIMPVSADPIPLSSKLNSPFYATQGSLSDFTVPSSVNRSLNTDSSSNENYTRGQVLQKTTNSAMRKPVKKESMKPPIALSSSHSFDPLHLPAVQGACEHSTTENFNMENVVSSSIMNDQSVDQLIRELAGLIINNGTLILNARS